MANFLSLPLELRHQILSVAVDAAEEFNTKALKVCSSNRFLETLWSEPYPDPPEFKNFKDIVTRKYKNYGRAWDQKIDPKIDEAFPDKAIHHAVASCPVVHELVQNLMMTHTSMVGDLVWVLGSWAEKHRIDDYEWRYMKLDMCVDERDKKQVQLGS